jgi:hypothetical protein
MPTEGDPQPDVNFAVSHYGINKTYSECISPQTALGINHGGRRSSNVGLGVSDVGKGMSVRSFVREPAGHSEQKSPITLPWHTRPRSFRWASRHSLRIWAGIYKDKKNFSSICYSGTDYLDLYPEFILSDSAKAFGRERNAACRAKVVGRFGWKIVMSSSTGNDLPGNVELVLRGIYKAQENADIHASGNT